MVLTRQASYDKKMLALQVIPRALGYRTALSSRPADILIPLRDLILNMIFKDTRNIFMF